MDKHVEVNGVRIEKEFLKLNIEEARQYTWKKKLFPKDQNHSHCIICGITISEQSIGGVVNLEEMWLCQYCYNKFISEF